MAELYGYRWNIELDVRSIKSFMNLSHVRCKSPIMLHREVWTTLLAYNLNRTTIALAGPKLESKLSRGEGYYFSLVSDFLFGAALSRCPNAGHLSLHSMM